jgi:hypothetical protein
MRLQLEIFDNLKIHLIKFAVSIIIVLLPLYISTGYYLYKPVPYDIDTCNEIRITKLEYLCC